MDNLLKDTLNKVEKHVDKEIETLDNFDTDDILNLRKHRLNELKSQAKQHREWILNGHGEYTDLYYEKDFFAVTKKSSNVVCHFFRGSTEHCKIVDMHMKMLAEKHIETKFCKIDAEKAPFLTQRLHIRIIPTIALIKNGKTKDYIVGFTDLGNRDDFNTEMLEWRIAQSGVIDYQGDLLTPPDQNRKKFDFQNTKSII